MKYLRKAVSCLLSLLLAAGALGALAPSGSPLSPAALADVASETAAYVAEVQRADSVHIAVCHCASASASNQCDF